MHQCLLLKRPSKIGEFLDTLQHTLSQEDDYSRNAAELWGSISSITYDTAIKVFEKRKSKNADRVEAFWLEMEPVITAKRTALLKYKQCPSKQKLEDLRNARNTSQQTARCCANKYWMQLCTEKHTCSDTGNIRGMFEGIKKATGPTQSKMDPLKSKTSKVITDSDKQMKRWVEHYLEIYVTENKVTEAALNIIAQLTLIEELDAEPTLDELEQVISCLTSGRALGSDGIPLEIIKCGKPVLLKHLHKLLKLSWSEKAVQQDMHDSNTINLYKNKGDCSDCNNY